MTAQSVGILTEYLQNRPTSRMFPLQDNQETYYTLFWYAVRGRKLPNNEEAAYKKLEGSSETSERGQLGKYMCRFQT